MTSEICKNCRKNFQLSGDNIKGRGLSTYGDSRHFRRIPFLLDCGHTLCGVCIHSAGKRLSVITCHDCGSRTPYDSSASPDDQLVPNVVILGRVAAKHLNLKCTPSLLWNRNGIKNKIATQQVQSELSEMNSSVETNPTSDLLCGECEKTADRKCQQCDTFLCTTCYEVAHAAAKFLRRHTWIPAHQATTPLPTCHAHPSLPLSHYCRREGTPVCADCVISSHKDHEVLAIGEMAESLRPDFRRLLQDAEAKLTNLKMKKQELGCKVQEIHQQCEASCHSVDQEMRKLYAAIQKRELALHKSLAKAAEQQIESLQDLEVLLGEDIGRVSGEISKATEVFKSDIKLLKHSDQLRVSLREVKEMAIRDVPTFTLNGFTLAPSVKKCIEEAGTFQTSAPRVTDSPAPTPEMDATTPDTSVDLLDCRFLKPSAPPPGFGHLSLSPSPSPVPFTRSISPMNLPGKRASGGSSASSVRSRSRTASPCPVTLKKEDAVEVWVTHVETPENFYIQLKVEEDQLQLLSNKLNNELETCHDRLTVSEIKEEMRVAARYTEDDLWYRAEIISCNLSPPPAYVTVLYLDYGNSENLSLDRLAKLPPALDGPFFGYKCMVSGIKPPSPFTNMAPPSWSQKAITWFKNMVEGEDVEVIMKEHSHSTDGWKEIDLYTVTVSDGSLVSIAGRLLQMGLAAKDSRKSTQLSSTPLPLPNDGSSSATSNKKALKSTTKLQLHRYNIPLQEPRQTEKKSKKKKKKHVSSPIIVPPTPPHPSSPHVPLPFPLVPLHSPEMTAPTKTTDPPATTSSLPWAAPLTIGQKIDCVVVQVNNPDNFYIQSLTYATEIQPLLDRVLAQQPSRPSWSPSQWCLATFNGKRWYRARVVKQVDENAYEVVYLDFGNNVVLPGTELAIMPPTLERYPAQAVKASLAGVVPLDHSSTWGIESSCFFSNLVLEHPVTATVQALPDASSLLIDVEVNGCDIAAILVEAAQAQNSSDIAGILVEATQAPNDASHIPLPDSRTPSPDVQAAPSTQAPPPATPPPLESPPAASGPLTPNTPPPPLVTSKGCPPTPPPLTGTA